MRRLEWLFSLRDFGAREGQRTGGGREIQGTLSLIFTRVLGDGYYYFCCAKEGRN